MKRSASSRFTKIRFAQDRPAVTLHRGHYLFEQKFPSKGKEDDELQRVCRSVIELECRHRIYGHHKQDPIAILDAATDLEAIEINLNDVIDYFDQFYNRISRIDQAELVT